MTPEKENIIRVCTRAYMDETNQWFRSWEERKDAIVEKYKAVRRLINNKDDYILVGNIIVDEWRKYE